MTVVMFHNRFVELVESGRKRHTIRGIRKGRAIQVGDDLSLRHWSGSPYRSKQVLIRDAVCRAVSEIRISETGRVEIDGVEIDAEQTENLAVQDGFSSFAEMRAWHGNVNGLPFVGVLIEWREPVFSKESPC